MRVPAQEVEYKSREMTEEVVATVRAKLQATLEAKLNGRITQLPVALGDRVAKGQLIASLDAEEISSRLEQADAALDQAQREWKRVSALFEQQGISASDYDNAKARLRIAEGAAAEARAMSGYVKITAPFSGLITQKYADVGDLAAPGKPLVEIEDPSTIQVEADIPEAIAGDVHRDDRMQILADGLSNSVTGIVAEMAPSADPVSRTFRVKLDLPQPENLKPGQFARMLVPIGEKKSLRVPGSAVVRRGELEILFVASAQHRAQMRLVKTGKTVGDEVEILSGLDPGDLVIVGNAAQLTDGQPVEVQ